MHGVRRMAVERTAHGARTDSARLTAQGAPRARGLNRSRLGFCCPLSRSEKIPDSSTSRGCSICVNVTVSKQRGVCLHQPRTKTCGKWPVVIEKGTFAPSGRTNNGTLTQTTFACFGIVDCRKVLGRISGGRPQDDREQIHSKTTWWQTIESRHQWYLPALET